MQTWGLVLITIPFWINFLIRTYAWVLLLRTQGVVNNLLLDLGFIQEPLQMLYTKGAVLLGMVYTFIPFMVLPIYVALEQMDKKLLEAASDLGATAWKSFWHITLPQTKSGIMTGSVLVYVSTTGMFVVTDILGGAKSAMISNIIQSQFLGARNWPFGSALSVIFVITSLIMIGLFNKAMTSKHLSVKEGRQ
ncbi:Spermidine/putrescine transport system permease protein PotB [compost metagenome]